MEARRVSEEKKRFLPSLTRRASRGDEVTVRAPPVLLGVCGRRRQDDSIRLPGLGNMGTRQL